MKILILIFVILLLINFRKKEDFQNPGWSDMSDNNYLKIFCVYILRGVGVPLTWHSPLNIFVLQHLYFPTHSFSFVDITFTRAS